MGKVFRQVVSKATNPEYKFTANVENFSLGELAAPILIFGDIASGTCNRAMIISFFGKSSTGLACESRCNLKLTIRPTENERLPVELGFVKQASPIILDQVLATSKLIADAANLITPTDNSTETAHKRRAIKNTIRDLHIGSGMTL